MPKQVPKSLQKIVSGRDVMADAKPPEGSFFTRWSQRKVQARSVNEKNDSDVITDQKINKNDSNLIAENSNISRPNAENKLEVVDKKNINEKSEPSGPTLDDVAKLTKDSDYSAFAARTVDPNVRNAAMRKLFAGNPHFNVMDGLDVYIDDYSVGEPIPKAMLRQMVQARSLGLLDDELVDQDKPPSAEFPTELAANDTAPQHENTDLQLQRDDAAGHSSVDESAEPDAKERTGLDTNLASDLATNPGADPVPSRPG